MAPRPGWARFKSPPALPALCSSGPALCFSFRHRDSLMLTSVQVVMVSGREQMTTQSPQVGSVCPMASRSSSECYRRYLACSQGQVGQNSASHLHDLGQAPFYQSLTHCALPASSEDWNKQERWSVPLRAALTCVGGNCLEPVPRHHLAGAAYCWLEFQDSFQKGFAQRSCV